MGAAYTQGIIPPKDNIAVIGHAQIGHRHGKIIQVSLPPLYTCLIPGIKTARQLPRRRRREVLLQAFIPARLRL